MVDLQRVAERIFAEYDGGQRILYLSGDVADLLRTHDIELDGSFTRRITAVRPGQDVDLFALTRLLQHVPEDEGTVEAWSYSLPVPPAAPGNSRSVGLVTLNTGERYIVDPFVHEVGGYDGDQRAFPIGEYPLAPEDLGRPIPIMKDLRQ